MEEISIPIVEGVGQEQDIAHMPCDFEEIDILSLNAYCTNVDNVIDVGRLVVSEPDNYQSTPTLSSEIIPRDRVAHHNSLQSRQLLAVVDGPDVCSVIVRHTVELLTDDSAAQSKPPLCDNQADNQSTVTWPCKCNECVQCLPAAPTIISTVAARDESDARSAPSEHCQNKRALRMGWCSSTNRTCYRYFARAKRKRTQQGWAVITLDVYAVQG